MKTTAPKTKVTYEIDRCVSKYYGVIYICNKNIDKYSVTTRDLHDTKAGAMRQVQRFLEDIGLWVLAEEVT